MKEIIKLTCLLVTLISCNNGAPMDLGDGSDYLIKYGYLSDSYAIRRSSYSNQILMSEAIQKYQRFFGLNITGVLNKETRSTMEKPRCGVKDIQKVSNARRSGENVSKWNKNSITYRVSKYSKKLKRNLVDDAFKSAFKIWSDVTNLNFTQNKKNIGDIEIKFAKGFHGDQYTFDGPGGILAHSTFPGGKENVVHFDDDEKFTDGVKNGFNLLFVAAHEFGHSLGLTHSDIKSSLMYPHYRYKGPTVKLHSNDIERIQDLYGIKKLQKKVPTFKTSIVHKNGSNFIPKYLLDKFSKFVN